MSARAHRRAHAGAAPKSATGAAAARAAARRRAQRRRCPRLSRLLAWLLSAVLGSTGVAHAQVAATALPAGGRVVVGSGQLQQGGNLLIVNQSSARLGMDWQSFNIGSAATVEFRQPGSDSIALNRVLGHSGSEIYGRLRANGQVFLTNPNGVLFAPGAKVDVGGLVASTLDLSQQDFADGRFVFGGGGSGAVVNQGSLRGNAGGYLALFGNRVDNQGEISVDAGAVVLASGRAATVSISGSGLISAVITPGAAGSVVNSGSIAADGGSVTLTAASAQDIAASLVNNTGIIRANTLVERNGEVWITGDQVATSGSIRADAAGAGNAGRVVVKGGMQHGSVQLGGSISASAEGGRGGEVETSAARVQVAPDTRVTTLSTAGAHGTWTIDPEDFRVGAGGAALTSSGIGADTLATNLNGGNVSLVTNSASGAEPGDIHVDAAVSWTGLTTLTMTATRHININADITAFGLNAGLVLTPGTGGAYTLATGSRVTLSGAQSTLQVAGVNYELIRDLAGLQAINTSNTTRSGNYALAVDIDASATASQNAGAGFVPIGSASAFGSNNSFRGSFDGLGHAITGLVINRPTDDHVGLFGTTHDATIRNLNLSGGSVLGRTYVGALAGYMASQAPTISPTTVTNVSSSVAVNSVSGTHTVYEGGLVGQFLATSGLIDRSSASGAVTANTNGANVGGLVGYQSAGSINRSSASGAVTATVVSVNSRSIGGLVGNFDGVGTLANSSASGNVSGAQNAGGLVGFYGSTGAINSVSASGTVSGTDYVGGLLGQWSSAGSITNAQAAGNVTGTSYAGGLVGYGTTSGSITNGTASGNVTGPQYVGGLAGYLTQISVSGSSASGQVTASVDASNSNTVYAGGLVGHFQNSLAGGQISGSSATGPVSSAAPYGYVGGLVGQHSGGSISGSTASGRVQATHTTINSRDVGGLVGRFDGSGTMSNVEATGIVSGGNNSGGLVGYYGSTGALNNATARGSVSGPAIAGNGSEYIGGLIGQMNGGGTITNSLAQGNVTSGYMGGGLIGYWNSSGSITDSRATGNVVGTNAAYYLGGLIGYGFAISTTTTINNSSAAGNVSGGRYSGGLAGILYDTHIVRGTATGTVTASDDSSIYTGGLVGLFQDYYYGGHQISSSSATGNVFADSANSYAGGLVGQFSSSGSLNTSTASGNVTVQNSVNPTSNSHRAGGLVGEFSGAGIADSAATGSVSGAYFAGGLVGNFYGTVPIANSSATGNVSGSQYVGGLVGYQQNVGINNGRASGNVTSTLSSGSAGGLVGYAYTYAAGSLSGFNDSLATGAVSGGSHVGGLIGHFEDYNSTAGTLGGIANSRASGNVSSSASGSTFAGGLVGYYNGVYSTVTGGISNSSASGTVAGTQHVGGLVGQFTGYGGLRDSFATGDVTGLSGTGTKSLGGLAGQFQNRNVTAGAGLLTRSYATGNVRLASNATVTNNINIYAGGLVGQLTGQTNSASTVTDSYATGAVTLASPSTFGLLRSGGLVGLADGSISTSYATGAVGATGGNTRTVGGLVAQKNGSATVTSSFWATDTSGQAASAGGTGTTLAQLKDDVTFAGWDLATSGGTTKVWRIYDGLTTPLLRGLLTPLSLTLADISKVYDGTTSLGSAAISVNGTAVSNPERILVGGVAANVGTYGLTAANLYSVQTGYDLGITGAANLTITGRPLTLSGLVANKVYDATTTATLASNPQFGGLVAGDDLIFQPGSGFGLQFATKSVGIGKTVNISGGYSFADGTVGRAANYILPSANTTTADITPATLTAGSFSATNRVYDGTTTVAVSATASPLSGVLGGDSVSVDLSSVSSGSVANKNVGNAKPVTVSGVSITGADAGNYVLAGLGSVAVNITPKSVTVNGINATDRQYNRGLNVNLTTNAASLAGVVSGDDVQPRLSGLSGSIANKNVGNAKPVTVSGLALRGIDAANYTAQAGAVSVNISPYELTLYLAHSASSSRVYDGTTTASVYFPVYWYGGDDLTPVATSIGYADKNVAYNGSGAVIGKTITASGISLTGADASNYALQNTTATISGTITPKPLAVSGVSAVNRVYDGTRDVTVNISGATVDTSAVIAGDVVGVSTPGTGTVTGQMADKNVANAKAVTVPGLSLTGADAANYSITSGSGGGVTVNITPKDVAVSHTASDKVYDSNTTVRTTATTTDFIAGDVVSFLSNDYVQIYYGYNPWASFTGTNAKDVGTGKTVTITFDQLSGTDAGNYRLTNTALSSGNATLTTTASITPKPVTLAFNGLTKVYDGTTDATVTLNTSASGVYSGDAVTTTQTAIYTGATAKNVGTGKPISVSGISLSGANAGNYAVGNTTATTTGTVTAKPVTLGGITATDRAYDGTTTVAVTAGTVTSSGFIAGDSVAVTLPSGGLSTGSIADKNVGTNKPVTVTGLTLSGSDAGNYSIDTAGSGITVNISARALTPTYTGISRVYNGGIAASVTPTTSGIASGDTVTFTQQAVFTGVNASGAGTNKPISISSITLGGAGAANYSLASTTASASADITPKPVTATYTSASRVYNGMADVSASVIGSSLQFIAGDSVGLTQTAQFTGDGAVGINKPVSITAIGLSGAQAANYSLLNTTASTTATITPRPLGVTGITAANRVYDGTITVAVNVSGASVDTSNVVAGDSVSVTLPPAGITTGSLADRHVGNNKPVSITGVAIGGSSAANYSLIGATGLTVNITPKSLTAVYAGANKVYDGSADAQINATSGDIFSVDSALLGFSAQGVFTGAGGKNVGNGKAVDVIGAFLTGAARDNYSLANPTGSTTADITPRPLTANYAGGSKVYDGTASAVVTGTLSNRVGSDVVGTTQTAEFTGTGARNVGTGKPISVLSIALTGADAGNYTLANTTDTTTGSITPKPITVSGLNNVLATDRVYDGTRQVAVTVPNGVTLVANSADIVSGDAVTINVPPSGATTGTVANKNVGNAKPVTVDGLSLSGADAANYSIAGTAGITVNITPKPLTANYSGVNRVYDGSTAATVTGVSGDLVGGDSLVIRGDGVFTGAGAKNVGTAKPIDITSATLSGADAVNYSLTNTTGSATADVTPRQLTPSYLGGSRVYDGSPNAPVSDITSGLVIGDNISLGFSALFTGGAGARNVGTGKAIQISGISLTGTDAPNYSLSTTSATATGSITPKPVTLTGLTGVTAANRSYDGTRTVNVTVTSTGTIGVYQPDIVPGDVVDVAAPASGLTTGTLLDKNAGVNKPLVVDGLVLTGADAANYTVAATRGITVTIAPRLLTAVYTGVNRVYDGTAAASVNGSSTDIVAGDSLTISGTGVFSAGKNAGVGKAISVTAGRLGSTDADNYTLINTTGSASADITPRPVTAAFVGGTRVYDGGTAAPVTGTLSGLIGGDTVALGQTAVFSGAGAKNVGNAKPVDISAIALSGADAVNYSLTATSATTTASVTPRPLGLIGLTGVSAADRVYDGTRTVAVTVATTGTVTPNPADLVAGDVVTITAPPAGLTTGTMADKNVGSNKPVAVAGLTLGGADAPNYSVASTSGVTVNITPRNLTASYSGVSRSYDGTAAASAIGTSADIVAGDNVLISATGVFSGQGGRNAGVGKSVELLNVSFTGSDAANYTLTNTSGSTTADITPRPVLTSYSGGTRVYDGTTAAPVSRNASGFISGDAVTVSETAVFTGANAKGVGSGKTVQISGVTLAGADAANYALISTSASTTGSITPRPLNVTGLSGITAVDRVYDGTRAVQVNIAGTLGSASGDIIAGDDVTVNVPSSGVGGGTMLDKNVGQNKPVVLTGLSLSGSDAPNYSIAGTAGLTVNIAQRNVNASYAGVNKVYDGTAAATVVGSSSDIVAGDTVLIGATATFSGAGGRNVGTAKPIDVGSGSLSGADAANYYLVSAPATTSADITPAPVTASYVGGTRVYDGTTTAPVTRTVSGLIAGDTVSVAETAVFTGAAAKNVGAGKAVQVSAIALSGSDAANYALVSTTAGTTASVTPRPINVTGLSGISAVDRVYNGTTGVQVNVSGSAGSASGDIIAGDAVTINVPGSGLGGGVMLDKHVGQAKPVVLTGLFLSGADAPNYAIAGTAGVTVNIAPLSVTLAGVSADDRVYDGTTTVAINSAGGSISGTLAGDDVQLRSSGVTGSMADKHVGRGKAVAVSGLSLAGTDAGNYTVANGGGLSVNIAPRTLTPSMTVADKVYDGTTGAGITLADDRVAGDTLSLNAGATGFADRNAGNNIAVNVSGLTATGADAGNYTLGTTTLSTTANIHRAPLTISANSLSKVYGDPLNLGGNEFSTLGLVSGETLGAVTLASGATPADAPVAGSPYTLSVSNASGGSFNPLNYVLSYRDGQVVVTPRPVTIASNSVVRFADEANPASFGFSTSVGGLVGGDRIGSVTQPAPAGSANAPGGSVYELLPSNAVFASGAASNYTLSYGSGLLVVLPKPPRIGDADGGGGSGAVNFAIQVSEEEVRRALAELDRATVAARAGGSSAGAASAAKPPVGGPTTPAELSVLLSGDGRRLTLTELQKMPLISFDPLLRRLIFAGDTATIP